MVDRRTERRGGGMRKNTGRGPWRVRLSSIYNVGNLQSRSHRRQLAARHPTNGRTAQRINKLTRIAAESSGEGSGWGKVSKNTISYILSGPECIISSASVPVFLVEKVLEDVDTTTDFKGQGFCLIGGFSFPNFTMKPSSDPQTWPLSTKSSNYNPKLYEDREDKRFTSNKI